VLVFQIATILGVYSGGKWELLPAPISTDLE